MAGTHNRHAVVPLDHIKGPMNIRDGDLAGFKLLMYRGRVVASVTNLGNQAIANAKLFRSAPDAIELLRAIAGSTMAPHEAHARALEILERLDNDTTQICDW